MISKVFNIVSPLLIIIGHCLGIPHFFNQSSCYQMGQPFPFGSIVITENRREMTTYAIIYIVGTNAMIVLIVATTILMFAKLNQKRKISSELHRKYNSKAEKTLTITMILILLPILMPAILSLTDLFEYALYPYLFPLRLICLDARAHLVSCHFYFTHPIFKKAPVYKHGCDSGNK
ncbi:unnamed protein product [Caenorhabditis brenneri]